MSMIGQPQRAITLGRYDNLAQVMSMSRFRFAPKIGHSERLKRLYGYLVEINLFAIRYRTKEPDYSHLPRQEYDGLELDMEMSKKKFQKTYLNH